MSKTEVKHVIWDWNGTLFDDAALCHEITLHQLSKMGIHNTSTEQLQRAFTHPVEEIYRTLGVDFEKHSFEQVASNFLKAYIAGLEDYTVRPEAKSIILNLKKRGIGQSVLSAVRHDVLLESIRHAELSECFDSVLGLSDHFAVSKINNGRRLLAEIGIPGSEVLVIGDTTHDLETAEALGAQILLIPSGYQHPEILKESGASLLTSLSELEEYLFLR